MAWAGVPWHPELGRGCRQVLGSPPRGRAQRIWATFSSLAWLWGSSCPCDLWHTCAEQPLILESDGDSPVLPTRPFSSAGTNVSPCSRCPSAPAGVSSPTHSLGVPETLTRVSHFSRSGAHSKRILYFPFWCLDLRFQSSLKKCSGFCR